MIENQIICGDCQDAVPKHIPAQSIDLIYIDPPFFSNKNYEILWGNGAEQAAYGDRWKGDIFHYIEWMRPRIAALHTALHPAGNFFIHADQRAIHHLRELCDEFFGYKNLVNEIAWCYNVGGRSKRRLGRKHDTILWYVKSNNYYFNGDNIRVPRDTGEKSFGGRIIEENGRKYQIKVTKRKDGSTKEYKYDLSEGKIPEDWWTDINTLQSQSTERIGYPTQKPAALLERIIKGWSQEGDLVVDGFVGGGTTIDVAKKLNRKWIGIDVSPIACMVSYARVHRLLKGHKARDGIESILRRIPVKAYLDIVDYPATIEEVLNLDGFMFQQWVMIQLNARINPSLTSDGGIDGTFSDGTPIEVKQTSVGRPEIQKFESAIRNAGQQKGVIVGKTFARTAIEYIARMRSRDIIILTLTLDEVLKHDFQTIRAMDIPIGV